MYRILAAFLMSVLCSSALAKTDVSYITAYGGLFDMQRDTKTGLGGLELRFNQVHDIFVPKLGGFVAGKGSTYFYAGFNLEFPIYEDCLYLIPGFAVGGYSKNKGERQETPAHNPCKFVHLVNPPCDATWQTVCPLC